MFDFSIISKWFHDLLTGFIPEWLVIGIECVIVLLFIILLYAIAVPERLGELVLRAGEPHLRGLPPPLHRLKVVLQHPVAAVVSLSEHALRG